VNLTQNRNKKAAFSEVANIITGKTPSKKNPKFFGGKIPFVTPVQLDCNDPVTESITYLTDQGADQATMIPRDSVMVVCIGSSIGKVGIAGQNLCTNQQVNSLVFDQSAVVPRYGYHYCKTLKLFLKGIASSTTLPIVNKSRFSQIKIPLPHLSEQKRIASILDKADALRAKRQQTIAKLDELLQSVFLNMLGDPERNKNTWPIVKMGDLLESVNYGTSKKAGAEGNWPILRMNNIMYSGEWDFTDLKYIDFNKKEEEKYLVYGGDILFNRTNSKELVGKTAVYRRSSPMAFAGYLVRGRVNNKAVPEYISGYLNSKHGKRTLTNMCNNIIGMANINAKKIPKYQDFASPNKRSKTLSKNCNLRFRS